MILTRQNIHAALNCGSPNSSQMNLLGVPYPLPAGWLRKLVGQEISDEAYAKLMSLKKPLKSKLVATQNVPRQPQVSGEKESLITAFVARCTGVMEERQRERAEAKAIFQPYIADQYFDIKSLCEDAEKVMRSLIANPSSPESAADALYAQSGRDLA